LKILKEELLNLTIVSHFQKKNLYPEANYLPKNHVLFLDPPILDKIKQYRIEIIKTYSYEKYNE
jgi:hypothetical protein